MDGAGYSISPRAKLEHTCSGSSLWNASGFTFMMLSKLGFRPFTMNDVPLALWPLARATEQPLVDSSPLATDPGEYCAR
jgi:hypothetical protein